MKKHFLILALIAAITGSAAIGCSSQQKASDTDTVSKTKATVPDTTKSPTTHMDPNQKPPM